MDQNGNLIDRHNLWEMVGVRFRRSIFPGYSDTAQFSIPCTGTLAESLASPTPERDQTNLVQMPSPDRSGTYRITAALQYRKVDQFLLNYLFGDENKLTSPVTEIDRATASVEVRAKFHTSTSTGPAVERLATASEERQK